MTPDPPAPRPIPAASTTPGISRNMTLPQAFGGGDGNGTAATSILHSQAGTAADKVALPRKPRTAMAAIHDGIV